MLELFRRCISIKKILRVDPGNRNRPAKLSLKLLDCSRKIESDIHIDTESSTYWQFFYYRPPGKFWSYRYTGRDGQIVIPRTRLTIYIYALDNRYGFSISVQPGIDCTTSQFLFMKCNYVWKKKFFKIFKSWQVCDWLAKWINMLRFMDLRWPRVFRHSNLGLVILCTIHDKSMV